MKVSATRFSKRISSDFEAAHLGSVSSHLAFMVRVIDYLCLEEVISFLFVRAGNLMIPVMDLLNHDSKNFNAQLAMAKGGKANVRRSRSHLLCTELFFLQTGGSFVDSDHGIMLERAVKKGEEIQIT